MSYFAALTPLTGSSYSPTSPTFSQDPFINTVNKQLYVMVTASINFQETGTQLLFTTATDRGRFFPTKVILCAEAVSGSSYLGPPQLDIGKNSPNYNDWLNVTLETPQYTQYGSGLYEFPTMADVNLTISAPPGTDIYYKRDVVSTSINDLRSIMLFGFYTNVDS